MKQSGMREDKFAQTLVSVGKKLIELRKKKGYTSHESFAYDYDLPRIQYWRLEKGKANFTFKTLTKVIAIHNLTLDKFFDMVDWEK